MVVIRALFTGHPEQATFRSIIVDDVEEQLPRSCDLRRLEGYVKKLARSRGWRLEQRFVSYDAAGQYELCWSFQRLTPRRTGRGR